ncbi:NeuD/PglB/VioB family sugar acetyltransferase [Nakamurella lactea]|uniref:NeuD/PglB/VioB family sugar acetyltransferase n=1 Tax=Nakamurella lactea TaxID=459515 RepID=UPI000409632B|nr:NeuD/PglB/VioB family sugar acetyltransferase [Nakamurella lactea]
MALEPVVLIAAGGLARETLAAIRAAGELDPIGLFDDNVELHNSEVGGVRVLGSSWEAAGGIDARVVVCAGSGIARAAIVERLNGRGVGGDRYATVVHPSATIGTGCTTGSGSILLANVVLTCDVAVGEHVVAMPNVTLTHDVVVDDFVTLCAGVSIGGAVRLGRGTYLGMNSSVRQGVRVGDRSTLGMGSVLLTDLPAGQTWVGVPSHPIGLPQNEFQYTARGAQQ